MKLFRMRTLGVFGIGFLAGSAAGRGPWEKTQASIDQLREKVSGGAMDGSGYGSTSSNGVQGQPGSQGTGARQLSEM